MAPLETPSGDRFVGRTAELAALASMYSSSAASPSGGPPRLLTLVGVGGSGKSRLARRLAEEVQAEFADGCVWVELAPLSDGSLVAHAVLDALDFEEQPEIPPQVTLVTELASRQLLLILDNCEHLLEASAALAQHLLSHCPELSILATSREPLGIRDETIYQVLPLSLPTGSADENALDADAVRLFDVRARQVTPDFALTPANLPAVVRVCTAVDGLPLAIELAAARVRMLSVSEIAARLNDAFRLLTQGATVAVPRHQTLRAAMDWSYNLLPESEQILLQRTAVFAGGFTLDAAEQVCGDAENDSASPGSDVPRAAVLDLLSNLANKSLIVIGERNEELPTRYGMLETIRQYAKEKLLNGGHAPALRARHLDWCVSFAEQAAPAMLGAAQGSWMARLDAEHSNFRAALRFAVENGAPELGLRLANALFRYWDRRGNFSEAIGWHNQFLAADLAAVDPRVRAQALYGLAAFHYRLSEFDRAFALGESSLTLSQQIDDRAGMATTLNLLGVMASEKSEFDRSFQYHEQALALRRALGDTWAISASLHNLGYAADQQGRNRVSLEYYEASLQLKRELGDPTAIALTLNNIGTLELWLGNYARGKETLTESLKLNRKLGDKQGIVLNLTNLGAAAFYLQDYSAAHSYDDEGVQLATELGNKGDLGATLVNLGELDLAEGLVERSIAHCEDALALFRAAGERVGIALALHHLGNATLATGEPESAAELQSASLHLYREVNHIPGTASALEGLATIAVARSEFPLATQLVGAASVLRDQAATPPHPVERLALDQIRAASLAALGERTTNLSFEQGRALPLAETMAVALAFAPSPITATSPTTTSKNEPGLQILALGQSRVTLQGQTLTPTDWTYTKSKELFYYLLSRHTATKEQIGLDLWADASPAQLRRIFHRVLRSLRQALGHAEWITYQDDVYALSADISYAYDVETFESCLANARKLLRTEARTPLAIPLLEQAIAAYQGDFLNEMEGGDWILFKREELRKEFLQALLTLGQLHFGRNKYSQAATVYQRALAEDNYLEIAHRELMRAWARQGEVTQALRHYQILVELLRTEFDAPPARETTALYESIRQGESV